MRRGFRTAGRWTLRGAVLLVVVVALDVACLAYPNPLFAHKRTFGEFTVYSSRPLPDGFEQTIDDVRERIEAMENARAGAGCRIYICDTPRRYSLFARLTRRSPISMAIGLSAFRNVFINEQRVRRVAADNHGRIRHCRFEGNFAEVIAHEIAHFNVVTSLGFWKATRLPTWKSEGYAEYQANIAATRADDSYNLADRVRLLMNREFWGAEDSLARRLYEWHILVEFLAEEQGYGLDELAGEGVTESSARQELLAWYRAPRSGP
jgi:hypothetical protein